MAKTIASILALTEKGTLCSAAVRDAEAARSVVNKDIEDKKKEGSRIDTDIAAIDQQLRGMRLSPERTELTTKRRDLVDRQRDVERALQQNPPSALMKRLLQVENDIANHRQCIAKARADLDGFVVSLAPKAKS